MQNSELVNENRVEVSTANLCLLMKKQKGRQEVEVLRAVSGGHRKL